MRSTGHALNEVLALLDPQKTVDALLRLADGKVPALLCFEGPADARWCHRALVSMWLKDTLDLEVFEYGLEREGCGHEHPKLPWAWLAHRASLRGQARLLVNLSAFIAKRRWKSLALASWACASACCSLERFELVPLNKFHLGTRCRQRNSPSVALLPVAQSLFGPSGSSLVAGEIP